jgi:hypothetical protein
VDAILEAIYSLFIATPHSDFFDGLGNRFYRTLAPSRSPLPYAVYRASGSPRYSFDGQIQDANITIDIYAATAATCDELLGECLSVFQDCALSPTGYTNLTMHRVQAQMIKDDAAWRWLVTFKVEAEKD